MAVLLLRLQYRDRYLHHRPGAGVDQSHPSVGQEKDSVCHDLPVPYFVSDSTSGIVTIGHRC